MTKKNTTVKGARELMVAFLMKERISVYDPKSRYNQILLGIEAEISEAGDGEDIMPLFHAWLILHQWGAIE